MTKLNNQLLSDQTLYFEDVAVGDSFKSFGRTVTEADVVNFAGLSGDFHALHMDATYAAATPHGRRIAHGMLVVAMTGGLVVRLPVIKALEKSTVALAGFECRFVKPTFIDDTIHVVIEVAGKTLGRKPDRGTIEFRRSVINQHGEVVIEGVWRLVVRLHSADQV